MSGLVSIISAGPMMTVQDRGRYGHLAQGISISGAMDRPSLAIANSLVGNEEDAAAIEFAMVGGSLSVDRDCRIAVTGGACDIRIGEKLLAGWQSHDLPAGEVLNVGYMRGAVWGYVAISGGIDVTPFLGSRSTHLRTGVGGHEGRVLRAGDRIELGNDAGDRLLEITLPFRRPEQPIRVMVGPQDDYFSAAVIADFFGRPYRISGSRDRMAMLLDGSPVLAAKGYDIVSDVTIMGSIQIPSSGRPMILCADCQTTGGYPKIATVISADLPRLMQMPAGASVRFQAVAVERAEELYVTAKRDLASVIDTLRPVEA